MERMTPAQTLVKTLDFQLDIQSDDESLLKDATLESRWAYNESTRLAKQGVDWSNILNRVADNTDLVRITTQRIVAKAPDAMENYYEYDDFGLPSHTKDGVHPLRANYEEGYNLTPRDDRRIKFRISAKPYKHVEGVLDGDDAHLDTLREALTADQWRIGTAETLFHNGTPELHVTVTNTERSVRDKQNSRINLRRGISARIV